MRVVFSPGGLDQRTGGVSRYVFEITQWLNTMGVEAFASAPVTWNQYFLNSPNRLFKGFPASPPAHLRQELLRRVNQVFWQAPPFFEPPELLHQTYYFDKFFALKGVKRVVTVYDMIYERYPQYFRFAGKLAEAKLRACNQAECIISISENTKSDLIDILGIDSEKIVTIPLAGSLLTSAPREPEQRQPFFLHVGGRRGYKNFTSLLQGVSQVPGFMRGEVSLVVFGGGPKTSDEYDLMVRHGIPQESVEFISGDDKRLAELYSRARALIYPSLYEGFGIPPLEAMSAGCPVIAGDNSSLPEVIGDAGLLVDTSNSHNIAEALSRINENSDLRLRLSAKGIARAKLFSWEKTARETLDVYRSILSL